MAHDAVVVAWVVESTARQGVSVKVVEPGVVGRVAVLFREGGRRVRAARWGGGGRGRSGCDPEPPG